MNGTQALITFGLLVFTVGIAVGSMLAARASKLRPNMALVPVGAFLMALACLDLGWTTSDIVRSADPLGVQGFIASFTGLRLATGLFVLSLAGGLFIVPSFAAVQLWARDDHKARVVAACNVLSAAFMVGASLMLAALQWAGLRRLGAVPDPGRRQPRGARPCPEGVGSARAEGSRHVPVQDVPAS